VLLVVTIVVILLSLAAWSYANKMMVEQEAAMMYGRDVEARMAAESGIEYAAIQIGQLQTEQTQDVFHNPALFRSQVMIEADNPRGQCRFTILVPNELSSAQAVPHDLVWPERRRSLTSIDSRNLTMMMTKRRRHTMPFLTSRE
jgi:hypothetical protein